MSAAQPVLRRWLDALLRWCFAWLLALLVAVVGIDPALQAMGLRARALEWNTSP